MLGKKMSSVRDLLPYDILPKCRQDVLPYTFLGSLVLCVLFAASLLFDKHFWFLRALLSTLGLLPSSRALRISDTAPFDVIYTFSHAWLFTGTLVAICVFYLAALYRLPGKITRRFILVSTGVLGLAYTLLPVLTSQDVLSYIAYGRMVVIYHLDPIVNAPSAIHHDYIIRYLYWVNQPSVYGPVWTMLVSGLQLGAILSGFRYALAMELLLRLFSLAGFLISTQLLWSLIGRLQGVEHADDITQRCFRERATLAFAWNPFLLLEACVNAHNDITILLLILLALWYLLPSAKVDGQPFVVSAFFLGLAACIKISYLILIPGVLLFVFFNEIDAALPWLQRAYNTALAALVAFGTIVVLHMPFWHHGALLTVLSVTPSASRDINSIYELGVNIIHDLGLASLHHTSDHGAWIEIYSHWVSDLFFVLIYLYACIRCLRQPRMMRTPLALLSWLNFVWLAYCFIGSPWFWPWYVILSISLLAIIEACQYDGRFIPFTFGGLPVGPIGRALSFSTLGLYVLWIFYGLLPGYGLSYVSSQLVWFAPLFVGIYLYRQRRRTICSS
ncbi:hypothetical protein ccbrp13_06540 [Ktedonobacteria bacterium brp13]|nr:hypothetical protein ccbrp13_06540 [Ktedonobacteria bacterium brp13]